MVPHGGDPAHGPLRPPSLATTSLGLQSQRFGVGRGAGWGCVVWRDGGGDTGCEEGTEALPGDGLSARGRRTWVRNTFD